MKPEDIKVGGIYTWKDDEDYRFRVYYVDAEAVYYQYLNFGETFEGSEHNRSIKPFCEEAKPVYTVEGFEV